METDNTIILSSLLKNCIFFIDIRTLLVIFSCIRGSVYHVLFGNRSFINLALMMSSDGSKVGLKWDICPLPLLWNMIIFSSANTSFA